MHCRRGSASQHTVADRSTSQAQQQFREAEPWNKRYHTLNAPIMRQLLPALLVAFLVGCGTTRWTDTSRTATEQLLISDAVDRAISQIDFSALANQDVYLDSRFIFGSVDDRYIISTLRQHMLATGCVVKDQPEDAEYIVEVRTGAVGTNRNDILLGTPATQLPSLGAAAPVGGGTIPEIALFKRTSQQGVCKVAVFAYDRVSGRPVWQSGSRRVDSKSRDTWVFGAGPFQSGSIYDGTKLSGERLRVPMANNSKTDHRTADGREKIWVAQEIVFDDAPTSPVVSTPQMPPGNPHQPASFNHPVTPTLTPLPPTAAPIPGSPQMVPPTPPPPPPPGPPGSVSSTPLQPNPTAATVGAIQAIDWAKTLRTDPKE